MAAEIEKTPKLLQDAVETFRKEKQERQSIEDARKRVPELREKALSLLGIEIPDRTQLPEREREKIFDFEVRKPTKESTEEALRKHGKALASMYSPVRRKFSVPIEDESIEVIVTKGKNSNRFNYFFDGGIEIDIVPLDRVLRIEERDRAWVESKAHNFKPFDMHTPIGPGHSSDLGPKWSREMNMNDFEEFNNALDRLAEPDVEVS